MNTGVEMKRKTGIIRPSTATVLTLLGVCGGACSSKNGDTPKDTGIDEAGDSDTYEEYAIDSDVVTTADRTIAFSIIEPGLQKHEIFDVSRYDEYGYGDWTSGPALPLETRLDIMPPSYTAASVTQTEKLVKFFTMTDIHITDEESPSQLIYLQQLHYDNLLPSPLDALGNYPWSFLTSAYSPVMLYTTQVLDAAVQTINAIHKQDPIDFGISLGDVCNSTQYNELRWYIDVMDGEVVAPSSGEHAGASDVDYQKPFKAVGLDKAIPWYQTLGNHDHFWLGSFVEDDFLKESYVSDTVIAMGDVMLDPENVYTPSYYMGVIDGTTQNGTIIHQGPVDDFDSPPKVVADSDRRSLLRSEWMKEFFNTSSNPEGHGFNEADAERGFACYSFVPKSDIPIKIIVLDDTQREDDGSSDIHGHGFLDENRYAWLKKELAEGDTANQLMIIAAHIPIGVEPADSELEWWLDPQNAVTLPQLIEELQRHPNLLMWIAGHRHFNTVKAFVSSDPVNAPEKGFWQVETSSLRDFPQQFRIFDIYLNSDYTVSIAATDVDPAVKKGTPAAESRKCAVAVQQIVGNNMGPNLKGADPTVPGYPDVTDSSIHSMEPSYSYNATLYKQLSPEMASALKVLYPTP